MSGTRRTVCLLAVVLVSACLVGPDYVESVPDSPDRWNDTAGEGFQDGSADLRHWWGVFQDPTLRRLIQEAVTGNLDLEGAFVRVLEARARRGVATGDLWPDLDATGDYRRARLSEDLVGNRSSGVGLEFDDYRVGVEASWEIDLFGRLRRAIEAADAELEASEADFHDLLLTLQADVALTYIELRSFQERIEISRRNLLAQEETYQMASDRVEAGAGRALDRSQALFNLWDTRADVPALEIGMQRARNRLAVLLGMPPQEVDDALVWPQPVALPSSPVAVGIPADLMRRRPDVRAAERRVAAQVARVGVATADLYPSLSLFGTLALQATDFPDLLDYDSKTFGFGPSVRWNLFDGDRIRSQIQIENARAWQAVVDYEQTVLFALEEVEAAMVGYALEQERRGHLDEAVAEAELAVSYARRLYEQGFSDFQNVLDAQRSLLRFEDRRAVARASAAANLVLLYRALGGGWGPE